MMHFEIAFPPPRLVQDHERCLWTEDSQRASADGGWSLIGDYPKTSPDLNAIEGVWKLLRDGLLLEAPSGLERQSDFVRRLKRPVSSLNRKHRPALLRMCTNQKERAADFIELKWQCRSCLRHEMAG